MDCTGCGEKIIRVEGILYSRHLNNGKHWAAVRGPAKPAPIKEPEFVGPVRDYLRNQGHTKAEAHQLLDGAAGHNVESLLRSVMARRDKEMKAVEVAT